MFFYKFQIFSRNPAGEICPFAHETHEIMRKNNYFLESILCLSVFVAKMSRGYASASSILRAWLWGKSTLCLNSTICRLSPGSGIPLSP